MPRVNRISRLFSTRKSRIITLGACPREGKYLLGAAIPAVAGAGEMFLRFKEKIRPFGYDLQEARSRETTLILRPGGPPGSGVLADGAACLLGEAGGYISPSSAEGFSYAFRTAMLV